MAYYGLNTCVTYHFRGKHHWNQMHHDSIPFHYLKMAFSSAKGFEDVTSNNNCSVRTPLKYCNYDDNFRIITKKWKIAVDICWRIFPLCFNYFFYWFQWKFNSLLLFPGTAKEMIQVVNLYRQYNKLPHDMKHCHIWLHHGCCILRLQNVWLK